MAHDRAGTGPWAWIKTVDAGDAPLRDDWLGLGSAEGTDGTGPELVASSAETGVNRLVLDNIWFSQQPRSIKRGDLLVYYAVGSPNMVFPAIVEVTTGDLVSEGRSRWNWRLEVRPLIVVPRLSDAPRASEIGNINPRTLRKSHSLISPELWDSFRAAFVPRLESLGSGVTGGLT
jgi:hypothetical protein